MHDHARPSALLAVGAGVSYPPRSSLRASVYPELEAMLRSNLPVAIQLDPDVPYHCGRVVF